MTRPVPRPGSASRDRQGIALLVAGGSLAGVALVVALEFAAGFLLGAPLAATKGSGDDAVGKTLAYLEASPVPFVADPALLWRNQPGAAKTQPINPRPYGTSESWTLEIDEDGFRRTGERLAATAGPVYRVLCVGDSVTFGFNADQPFAYPRRLLDLLRERFPGKTFEVVNAAVSGWSWLQGLRFLELHASALDPDVVVIGHGTNDQFFPARTTDEERLGALASPFGRALDRVADTASRTNLAKLAAQWTGRATAEGTSRACAEQERLHGSCRRVSVEQIRSAVRKVAGVVAAAGADLLVVNTDFVRTGSIGAVREATADGAIPFLDLVAELAARKDAADAAEASGAGLAVPGPAAFAAPPGRLRIVLRVRVPDRTRSYHAAWRPYLSGRERERIPLGDDGRHGDERAGDGVFSGTVETEEAVAAIEYGYLLDGTPDFEPLPPVESSLSDRLLLTPAGGFGPVDTFGRSRFMAELVHPNRDGYAVIAELVAERLATLPSLRDAPAN